MWSLVGNNIVTLPFFWAELKILKGEWILDLNGFGNTQRINAPLNPPYTTENNWGLKDGEELNLLKLAGDLWELQQVIKQGSKGI